MKEKSISAREYRLMRITIGLYLALMVIFLVLFAKDVLADSLTEAQLQEYIHSLPEPSTLTTESIPQILDDGIQMFIIETPSMDVPIQPEPELITFPLSAKQVSQLEQAWIERAIREGKEPLFYVKLAAGESAQKVILARLARDQALCGDGFEIWEGSGICNVFTNHVSAEQNYNACLQTLDQSRAEYGACALNNFQLWDALQKKTP